MEPLPSFCPAVSFLLVCCLCFRVQRAPTFIALFSNNLSLTTARRLRPANNFRHWEDTTPGHPVTGFGYQHCKTDPAETYRYLWVTSSPGPSEELEGASTAAMKLFTLEYAADSIVSSHF